MSSVVTLRSPSCSINGYLAFISKCPTILVLLSGVGVIVELRVLRPLSMRPPVGY